MFGACDPYPLMGRPKIVMGCAHTAHVGYPKWDWGAPEKFSSREWEMGDLTTFKVVSQDLGAKPQVEGGHM